MNLHLNEAPLDRAARIVLGVALFVLAAAGAVAAPWVYPVLLVGAILVGTGIVGFCPLYAILRVTTLTSRR